MRSAEDSLCLVDASTFFNLRSDSKSDPVLTASPSSPLPTPIVSDRAGAVRVAFVGRLFNGSQSDPDPAVAAAAAIRAVEELPTRVVINRQVHSDRVVEASEAPSAADGLVVDTRTFNGRRFALCVFTADCVPILVADPHRGVLAAFHAGWRGLASGIIERGVNRLGSRDRRRCLTAWIGPSIGGCCYEVSAAVAVAVAQQSGMGVILQPASGASGNTKPHLHLVAAASAQLMDLGVLDVRRLGGCTRCDENWHSYRREGAGQGRNHAFIWRTGS